MKSVTTLAIVMTLIISLHSTKAFAHGSGGIVMLPFILAGEIYDGALLTLKARRYDFKINKLYNEAGNVLNISFTHSKSNSVYQIFQSNTLDKAKTICAKIPTGRLATPEEVARLYPLKALVKEIEPLLSLATEPGIIRGYHDGAENYFKMDLKTKRVDTFVRLEEVELSPVICIQKHNVLKDMKSKEFKDIYKESAEDFGKGAIDIIKNP